MALTCRVAICEKMMMPAATIQVTSIEFVIPKPPNWTSICGFSETPSCSGWVYGFSAASVDVARANPQSNITTAKRKQRLRIFVSTAVAGIGDASLPRSSASVPHSRDYNEQADPGCNLNAHTKARFAPDDKQNS